MMRKTIVSLFVTAWIAASASSAHAESNWRAASNGWMRSRCLLEANRGGDGSRTCSRGATLACDDFLMFRTPIFIPLHPA
jgi:hypothetical protein